MYPAISEIYTLSLHDALPIFIRWPPITISAQVNRVPVIDGHLMTASVKLRTSASIDDVRAAFESFEGEPQRLDRKSTRLNSSHSQISYAVFCLKKKKKKKYK